MNYLSLNDIEAHKIAFDLSNKIWDIVATWTPLAQKTIGSQFINASDSISANIAEGFGRYFKKDKIKFYHYSRGSVFECFDWLEKSVTRKLIDQQQHQELKAEFDKLPKLINTLIRYTNLKLKE